MSGRNSKPAQPVKPAPNHAEPVRESNSNSTCQTITVEQAGKLLGISRAAAYAAANDGSIPAIRLGKRRLVVPKAAIEKLLMPA